MGSLPKQSLLPIFSNWRPGHTQLGELIRPKGQLLHLVVGSTNSTYGAVACEKATRCAVLSISVEQRGRKTLLRISKLNGNGLPFWSFMYRHLHLDSACAGAQALNGA